MKGTETEPLTNAMRKTVRGLDDARRRRESGLFVAEGTKCVLDTAVAFDCVALYATHKWLDEHSGELAEGIVATPVTAADIARMTHLQAPQQVMAVFRIPDRDTPVDTAGEPLIVALDRIQDPGNLGTIIRVADWMGVRHILASNDTVDVYNPKVVQATMGSLARVRMHYVDLVRELGTLAAKGMNIYGTLLDDTAQNIYTAPLSAGGVLVMGNEGRGISAEVRKVLTHKLYIPPYPPDAHTAESLNVAVATSIALAEFRRRNLTCAKL